MLGRTKDKMRT